MASSENFSVRRLTSPEEVRHIISERAAINGYRPGALDHVSYFAADKTGFFVGELDGKPISCISVVKFTDDNAFVGNYAVDEPYRGKGYGLLTFKAATESLNEGCNIGGNSTEGNVKRYEIGGYKRAWRQQRFNFVASKAVFVLSGLRLPPAVKIQPASEVKFHDILTYDTSVHLFSRQSFLEKWISAPNCHAYVATSEKGAVVGYVVVRTTLSTTFREDGWSIGPLFADNSQIAKSLYQRVFESVASEDPEAIISNDVPLGDPLNPDALRIANQLCGRPARTITRMYKKSMPPGALSMKIFGITTSQIG